MGIIDRWISPEFEKREELLEFVDVCGPHAEENLAEIMMRMLEELDLAPKLLTITGDNTANNRTLCDSLHAVLLKNSDNKDAQFRIRLHAVSWTAELHPLPCPHYQSHLQERTGLPEGRLSSRLEGYTGRYGHTVVQHYLCPQHKRSNHADPAADPMDCPQSTTPPKLKRRVTSQASRLKC